MTDLLPSGIEPEDEIAVSWKTSEEGVTIDITLGGASVTVASSYDSTETVPWIVASLPQILEAAWAEIEKTLPEEA